MRNTPGWATYLRVSDEDKQTPERSFAIQRQTIQEQLLKPSDLQFTQEYQDILTGTNTNRKEYQQLFTDAAAGKFSHLGLYRADRFGRNTAEGLDGATTLMRLGVKIRVANMPSLTPETPDGYFMFNISMGLAQHEVDVLRVRTRDGMEQKFRNGGWPQRAPDGYVNKERLISSNKYDRWVEIDPDNAQILKNAWDLLLTGRYTLKQICDELVKLGYTRQSGMAWAWNDPKTGNRKYADNRLHRIFHNPFYAGWVVSKRFNIKMGEIRGQWDPIISTNQYHQGIEILRDHDANKSRVKKNYYLLRGILWLREKGRPYKFYGSTPSGMTKSFSYYLTQAKIQGKKVRIPCKVIDDQIPEWLGSVTVEPELIQPICDIYKSQIQNTKQVDWEAKITDLKRKISGLKEEEARLGRLYITGKMSEETYDRLYAEWQEKLRNKELSLAEMESEASKHYDDLDMALSLMSKLPILYERLSPKEKTTLLQIIAKKIIVSTDGKIVDYKLNSPFTYLQRIAKATRFEVTRTRPGEVSAAGSLKSNPMSPDISVNQFLPMLRFEQRGKLEELSLDFN